MAAIKALCSRAILMRDGAVSASGKVADVVDDYLLGAAQGSNFREWPDPVTAPGNEHLRLVYIRITSPEGKAVIDIDSGADIEIGLENFREKINLGINLRVTNSEGVLIFVSNYRLSPDDDSRCGFYQAKCTIPGHLLNAGRYSVDLGINKDQRWSLLRVDNIASFEVENTATGRGANMSVAQGVVRPLLSWSHSLEEESSLVDRA